MRATKLIKEINYLSYIVRLNFLQLSTLQYRRFRGDQIMIFKLLSGEWDPNTACQFVIKTNLVTRGRFIKRQVHCDLHKYYFGNPIISL